MKTRSRFDSSNQFKRISERRSQANKTRIVKSAKDSQTNQPISLEVEKKTIARGKAKHCQFIKNLYHDDHHRHLGGERCEPESGGEGIRAPPPQVDWD